MSEYKVHPLSQHQAKSAFGAIGWTTERTNHSATSAGVSSPCISTVTLTVYISSRKAEACEATARELGENCIALPADISTIDGCKALAHAFSRHQTSLFLHGA